MSPTPQRRVIASAPQLGVLIMDDGREFGDYTCARLPLVRPNSVRLAIEGAPPRPGVRTVGVLPPEKFTVRSAVIAAAAEGLFWIAAPRRMQDALTAFVGATRGAAGVLDEDHPGFAIVFADSGWEFSKVALIADLRDPVTTGMAAWAAVGVARQFGTRLDVLVLGADASVKPKDWREAITLFSIRGAGEQLVRDALERAQEHGVELRWRPLGDPVDKANAILRAAVEGGYDVVVDDLPPITVGPKIGRRRRVQAALTQAGSNATAYRLVRDAPCSVVVVIDAVRLGLIPQEVLRMGAATLAIGVVGVGAAAATGGAAAAQTTAMPAQETTVAADAVAQAEAAADTTPKTEEDLAAMEQELAAAQASQTQTAAELSQLQADQASLSAQLQSAQAAQAELQPQLEQAKAEADEAAKESATLQVRAAGQLERLPGGPADEEVTAAKQAADAAQEKAAGMEATYESLTQQQQALSAELQQVDAQVAATQAELATVEASVATLSAETSELRYELNPVVVPIAPGYDITAEFGDTGGYWSAGYHTGVDFVAPTGTDVYAAKDGVVVEAGYGGAYGNTIVIEHEDGTQSRYAHLSASNVSVGDTVTAGQHIGDVGSTGNTTGPHLHFEVMDAAGNFIDPLAWLGL